MGIVGQHINKLLRYIPFQQRIPVSTLEGVSGIQYKRFRFLLQQGLDLLVEAGETANAFWVVTFTYGVGYWCFFEPENKEIILLNSPSLALWISERWAKI